MPVAEPLRNARAFCASCGAVHLPAPEPPTGVLKLRKLVRLRLGPTRRRLPEPASSNCRIASRPRRLPSAAPCRAHPARRPWPVALSVPCTSNELQPKGSATMATRGRAAGSMPRPCCDLGLPLAPYPDCVSRPPMIRSPSPENGNPPSEQAASARTVLQTASRQGKSVQNVPSRSKDRSSRSCDQVKYLRLMCPSSHLALSTHTSRLMLRVARKHPGGATRAPI